MALTQVAGGMIASGQTITSPTLTSPTIDSAQVPTVSGTAPLYMARAWVNFNGTGTPAIRGSGNVSSITDNGTGDYTVNFTSALVDANYAVEATGNTNVTTGGGNFFNAPAYQAPSTSAVRVATFNQGGSNTDMQYVNVAVFR